MRYFWKLIQIGKGWLNSLWPHNRTALKTAYIEELPDHLNDRVVYIVGQDNHNWFAAMLCPCGCNQVLHMSLYPDGHPRWQLIKHNDGTVSLQPSVWRKVGCQSHFFLTKGQVKWCYPN